MLADARIELKAVIFVLIPGKREDELAKLFKEVMSVSDLILLANIQALEALEVSLI